MLEDEPRTRPEVVDRSTFDEHLEVLRAREKAHTREGDATPTATTSRLSTTPSPPHDRSHTELRPSPRQPVMAARHVAFLRALNVGGHTVKMDRLKAVCTEAGLAGVETFIASGNVLFEPDRRKPATVEALLEAALRDALGYEVDAFVRTAAELAALVGANPYAGIELVGKGCIAVGFLKAPPPAATVEAVRAESTPVDTLDVVGRELWWCAREGQGRPSIDDRAWRRMQLPPMTVRNLTTVAKLAAKAAWEAAAPASPLTARRRRCRPGSPRSGLSPRPCLLPGPWRAPAPSPRAWGSAT